MASPFSKAAEAVASGFENLITQTVAKAGGPAAASFTMRALASLAKTNEPMARGLFELIKAVEKPAEFAAGAVEKLLPILEQNGGVLGIFARTSRGFLVNVMERGLTRYYDELKKFADAGDFDGFRTVFGTAVDEEETRLRPASGKVAVLVLNPMAHMAYVGKDDPSYIAARAAKQGTKIVSISPPKASSGEIKVTEIKFDEGEIGEYEIDFDEALRHPFISFNQSSFPDMVNGFQGGTLGRKAKGSAWSQLSSGTRRHAGIVMAKVMEWAEANGAKIATADQIQQIKSHCMEKQVLEMIAEAGTFDPKTDELTACDISTARVWILIAGDHASADMAFAQRADNVLNALLDDYHALRSLGRKGLAAAKKWATDVKLVKRSVWHGRWSFRVGVPFAIIFFALSCFPEQAIPFPVRLGLNIGAILAANWFAGWLIYVGWFVGVGRAFSDSAGEILAFVGKKFGVSEETTAKTAILDYNPGSSLQYMGFLLGAFVWMAFLMNTGIFIEEAVKHWHDPSVILRLMLVVFLSAIIGAELFFHRVEKVFVQANNAAKRETLGAAFFWRVLKAKPGITLVAVVPLLVVILAVFDVKNRGAVEESIVTFADNGDLRLGSGTYVRPKAALKDDASRVWECSISHVAHVARAVENLPDHMENTGTFNDSRWTSFSVNSLSRILYASRHWRVTIVSAYDLTSGRHLFTLPNGEAGAVESSFPDAPAMPGAVRIPPDDVEYYRTNRPGTTGGADYLYESDGLVRAQDADLSRAGQGASAAKSAATWFRGKSLWHFLGFGALFLVLGFAVIPGGSEEVSPLEERISARGVLGFLCIGFAVLLFVLGFAL